MECLTGCRIMAVLFYKIFWVFEKMLFLLPTALIRLWIGLWIMLPGFYVTKLLPI